MYTCRFAFETGAPRAYRSCDGTISETYGGCKIIAHHSLMLVSGSLLIFFASDIRLETDHDWGAWREMQEMIDDLPQQYCTSLHTNGPPDSLIKKKRYYFFGW
jgi:hypothetical protein